MKYALPAAMMVLCCAGYSCKLEPETEYVYQIDYYAADLNGILLAGYTSGGTSSVPVYWEDGDVTEMEDNGYGGSAAVSVENGGTIFSAGRTYDAAGINQVPCAWSGTALVELPLPPDSPSGAAESIFITDTSVYVSGWYEAGGNPGEERPCYWTAPLPSGTVFARTDLEYDEPDASVLQPVSRARAVAVVGGQVCTAGYFTGSPSGNPYPCYWLGTDRTTLRNYGNGKVYAVVEGEAGTPVFGGCWDNTAGTIKPCIWNGGAIVEYIPDADPEYDDYEGCIFGLCYSGGALWTAGWIRDTVTGSIERPAVWEEGVLNVLPHGSGPEWATGIVFRDGQAFLSGVYSAGGSYEGCVWSDNVRYYLPGGQSGSAVNSISLCGL